MNDGPWFDLGTTLDDLPDDLRARIKAELATGERLLWASMGTPTRKRDGTSSVTGGIIAAICLLSGLLILRASHNAPVRPGWQGEAPITAGLVLVIIGLLFTLGTAIGWSSRRSERKKVATTLYVLTDQRAVLWKPVAGTEAVEVHTILRGAFKKVHRLEFPDGSGDVILNDDGEESWDPIRLEGVREVRRAEDLIRRTLLHTESPAA